VRRIENANICELALELADARGEIPGALTRIAGLFSGRGYNIDTLNVAPTQDPSASRMTIVTRGDDAT